MTATVDQLLADAYGHYQRGDFAGAERLGQQVAARGVRTSELSGLLGMIALQTARYDAAVPFLRAALQGIPGNLQLRSSLAFALINSGDLEGARTIAAVGDHPQLGRITAFIDQQRGNHAAAAAGYRAVLRQFDQDYESWNNLGLTLSAMGEIGEAVAAFERAIALRPEASFHINLSQALAKGMRHPERQTMLRAALRRIEGDPSLLVELGLAEAATGDFEAAERAHEAALAIAPTFIPAYLEYGMMLEALNRLDDLRALIERAARAGVTGPEIAFVEAWLLKREGHFSAALEKASTAGGHVDAARHAQLLGDIHDRLGHADAAFAAFAEMNRLGATGPAAAYALEQDFAGTIAAGIARLTPGAAARWSLAEGASDASDERPSPIFVLGFPRSGTTLLDTLLMNLDALQIFEEAPMVERVAAAMGDTMDSATLSSLKRSDLRERYFAEAALAAPLDERRIVDKFPFHLVRAPLIHRMFPEARMVFVERHPCDVVLSCFMARFQVNRAMIQFTDLTRAARLYDLAMTAWEQAERLLPLTVHRIRYERLIDDVEGEMRALLQFLDLPWRDAVLDNAGSAARRRHIATASYAQVAEPIYRRASGRWQRYRRQMEPVLPLLAPWADKLGYSLDPII